MTEPKFTPGPWKFVWQNNDDIQISFAGVVMGDNIKVIGHGKEQIANTHLIAAAPELYEALERLMNGTTDLQDAMDANKQAKAALAKARGENLA